MTVSDADPVRSTRQEDLELDPAESGPNASQSVESMPIDTPSLFRQALEQTRMAITIVDVHQPDSPIVYVNQAFTELTGFESAEAVGRNCRFLQGPETDPASVEAIRATIEAREVRVLEVLNYRKDGTTFWNSLHIGPIYDESGRLTHLYGSQWDVTDIRARRSELALQVEVARELHHRTRNLFGVISSIIGLSARDETDVPQLVSRVKERLAALAMAHEISVAKGRVAGRPADLYDFAATILDPYRAEDGDRVVLGGPVVQVPRAAVTPLGMLLHELATNAVKYGALSVPEGTVTITWRRRGGRLRLVWREEGGPAVEPPRQSGGGTRMMDGVLRSLGATMTHDWSRTGLVAEADMPFEA